MSKKHIIAGGLVLLFLLGAGCTSNSNMGKSISVSVKEKEYTSNNANQFVQIDVKVVNNLGAKIYFGNLQCSSPISVYQLSPQQEWKKRYELSIWCTGLGPGKDVPEILKSGKTLNTQQGISGAGTYKIEFLYYLNESDYKHRTSPQSIYSNEFSIVEKNATNNSVLETCKKNDSRKERMAECLYVAAKNVAEKDLNLALQLCGEIKKLNYGFDGCYDGVALMLGRADQTDKVTSVCNNYTDADRIKQCLNIAK